MALKPLNDRIVVKPEDAETQTASGIYLPDSAQEKPQRGRVIAVGPGKLLDNGKKTQMDVQTGDLILYGKYSGTEVKLGAEELVILRQDDVLAIVPDKGKAGAPKKAVARAAK